MNDTDGILQKTDDRTIGTQDLASEASEAGRLYPLV